MSIISDIQSAEEAGRKYCQEWLDGPIDNMTPAKSQDVNPYQTGSSEFFAWEVGFWNELRRYMIGIMQPRN